MKGFTPHLFRRSNSLPIKKGEGFTLIELILVVALMAIIGGMSAPFFPSFQVSSDLYTYTDTVARTLRRAQSQSITGKNENSWGVYFNTVDSTVTLFYGNNYATRDQSYDEVENIPASFDFVTDFSDEIFFDLYSGSPSAAGSVVLTSSNSESETVLINSLGVIDVE